MEMKPLPWMKSAEAALIVPRLRAAPRSVLMLDYDGTLAPFQLEPGRAYPYPGVEHRLAALAGLASVRLVLVSGRPVQGLAELLETRMGGKFKVEIWGNHGREHLGIDGTYELEPLDEREQAALERVKSEIGRMGFLRSVEAKPASLAVHWRGFDPAAQKELRAAIESLYAAHAQQSNLQLLAFDGGLELRSDRRNKGAAVAHVLAEEEPGVPAAYLGDDITDEDAFRTMGDRGFSILVREEVRDSAAPFWIRPPEELLQFLDRWIEGSGTPRQKAALASAEAGDLGAGLKESDQ